MGLEIQDVIVLCQQLLPLRAMWLHRVTVRVMSHHDGLHLKCIRALGLAWKLWMLSLVCFRLHVGGIQAHRLWLSIVVPLVRADELAGGLWFVLIHNQILNYKVEI